MIPYRYKIAFYTLGCKVNYSETSYITRKFEENNFRITSFNETSDIYVINTCAVTQAAVKKSRYIIQKAIKKNPAALIVITGCMTEIEQNELKKYNNTALIINTNEKYLIFEKIKEKLNTDFIISHNILSENEFFPTFSYGERTRSFLKIQDGCNYFCSYCVVPYARGRSRSDSIENIIQNIKKITDLGIKEIIITGINIGDFKNKDGKRLIDLLLKIEDRCNISRLRLSSIEPDLLNDEIIQIVSQSEIFMPHFHIPLQSGTDKILRLMNRKYDTMLFKNKVGLIKKFLPDCCIATDIITGFPGETDIDFETTYHFLNNLELSYFHVFTYSERENTKAYHMQDKVSYPIKKQRTDRLLSLSAYKRNEFYNSQKGKQHEILFESDNVNGYMYGFTKNYIRVKMPFNKDFENKIHTTTLNNIDSDNVFIIDKDTGQIK